MVHQAKSGVCLSTQCAIASTDDWLIAHRPVPHKSTKTATTDRVEQG